MKTYKVSFYSTTHIYVIMLLLGFLSFYQTSAQSSQSAELTYKSGVKVKCQVIKMIPEESVTIILLMDTLTVPWERLESIDLNSSATTPVSSSSPRFVTGNAEQYYKKMRPDMPYKGETVYLKFGLTTRGGVSPWFVLNPGTTVSIGYNLKPKLSVGFTASSDVYWNTGASLYPIGVEGIYRAKEEGFTAQYTVKTGYSAARKRFNSWNGFDNVTGGPFINVGVGFNTKKREHTGFFLNFNTMLTRVTESGLTNINTGRGWEQVEATNVRNIARTGFTIGLYID